MLDASFTDGAIVVDFVLDALDVVVSVVLLGVVGEVDKSVLYIKS